MIQIFPTVNTSATSTKSYLAIEIAFLRQKMIHQINFTTKSNRQDICNICWFQLFLIVDVEDKKT